MKDGLDAMRCWYRKKEMEKSEKRLRHLEEREQGSAGCHGRDWGTDEKSPRTYKAPTKSTINRMKRGQRRVRLQTRP